MPGIIGRVEYWKNGFETQRSIINGAEVAGDRWNELNGKEEEFVSAFTDFVERLYISMGELIQNLRAKASGR